MKRRGDTETRGRGDDTVRANNRRVAVSPRPRVSPVGVALLGFGNVGRAFARYLQDTDYKLSSRVSIRAVADSSGGLFVESEEQINRLITHKQSGRSIKEFANELASVGIINDAREFIRALASAGIAVLVESLPTNLSDGQPALDLLTSALAEGINVVTVDKGPLVHGFDALNRAAQEGGARLGFSGMTGVRIPDELSGDRVLEIRGVLNGTTNYILTEMQERKISFDEALARAQTNGIAEPDPRLDIEGWDTAAKILILAKALMRADASLSDVSRIGIGRETESLLAVARESGRIVRLVGRARIYRERVRVSVAPKLVGPDSPFFSVAGTSKTALFRTAGKGEVLASARSGRDAISQTILEDLIAIIPHVDRD